MKLSDDKKLLEQTASYIYGRCHGCPAFNSTMASRYFKMLPWDQLDETSKTFDRAAAKHLLRMIDDFTETS